jgi:hypothetical protein
MQAAVSDELAPSGFACADAFRAGPAINRVDSSIAAVCGGILRIFDSLHQGE